MVLGVRTYTERPRRPGTISTGRIGPSWSDASERGTDGRVAAADRHHRRHRGRGVGVPRLHRRQRDGPDGRRLLRRSEHGHETVEDVNHHPCTDGHTAEVFYVADYSESGALGVDAFDVFTEANCPPSFQAYTGLDFYSAAAEDYDIGLFYPLEEGWDRGDHEITCYIVRIDGGQMTASLKQQ